MSFVLCVIEIGVGTSMHVQWCHVQYSDILGWKSKHELDGSIQATQCISVVIHVCQCNCDSPRIVPGLHACLLSHNTPPSKYPCTVTVLRSSPDSVPAYPKHPSVGIPLHASVTACGSPGINPGLHTCLLTACTPRSEYPCMPV